MTIHRNISLKPYNTFGIDVMADAMADCHTTAELADTVRTLQGRSVVVGGGSNILFLGDFHGTVIRPLLYGIEVTDVTDRHVDIRVGAGVVWDGLVAMCVANGWSGIENLSYIPGRVGAAPVQNVGAYGAEAADVIRFVNAISTDTGAPLRLSADECMFGYRRSIFKHQLKGKAIVTSVEMRLATSFAPNLDYGPVRAAVEQYGRPTLANIRRAIIDIRRAKLPEPDDKGSAGSFFKNPEINEAQADALLRSHPDMPTYKLANGMVKVPAGWLIEQAGWKGRRQGNAGVHDRQALIIVNHGGATGTEIMALAEHICADVRQKFGISLDMEVVIV